MQEWGKRTDGLTIYQLAEHVIVDTDGNLYYSNELEHICVESPFVVELPCDFDFLSPTAADYCKSHIINQEDIAVHGYHINLLQKTISRNRQVPERFFIIKDGDSEVFKYKNFRITFFYCGITIIQDQVTEQVKKALKALVNARLLTGVDSYEPFETVVAALKRISDKASTESPVS